MTGPLQPDKNGTPDSAMVAEGPASPSQGAQCCHGRLGNLEKEE